MSKFQWSISRQRYEYAATGNAVSVDKIRGWAEQVVSQAKSNLEAIAKLRQAEKINNAEWVIRSGEEIKNLHRSLAMIANGGREQMGPSQWASVGGNLRRELGYLNRFANELDNIPEGAVLTDEFVRRAGQYAGSAYSTYANGVLDRERINPENEWEKRNLESGAQHCATCLSESAKGEQPVGTLKRIMDSECGGGCRCWFTFGKWADLIAA